MGYINTICVYCCGACVSVVGNLWGDCVRLFCKLLIYRKINVKRFGSMENVLYFCSTRKEIRAAARCSGVL